MPLTEKQKIYQRNYYIQNKEKRLAYSKQRNSKYKDEKKEYDKQRRLNNADQIRELDRIRVKTEQGRITQILSRAKARAKSNGIDFNISREDIVIPEFCPILGIKLEFSEKRGGHSFSPSIDRINPSLGYVKGNVHIISMRANFLKYNASIDEILKISSWIIRNTPAL